MSSERINSSSMTWNNWFSIISTNMAISKHTLMLKHMLGEYLGPNISNQTFSHSKIEESSP